jgi:hypothetical protein
MPNELRECHDVTLIAEVPVTPFSVQVAAIVVFPLVTPVTTPLLLTTATEAF